MCPLCHSMMYSLMIPIPPINYFPATTPTRAGYPLCSHPHSGLSQPNFQPSQDDKPGCVVWEKQFLHIFLTPGLSYFDWLMHESWDWESENVKCFSISHISGFSVEGTGWECGGLCIDTYCEAPPSFWSVYTLNWRWGKDGSGQGYYSSAIGHPHTPLPLSLATFPVGLPRYIVCRYVMT